MSKIVKVIWKDEGDFGPITLLTQDDLDRRGAGQIGRPFDPNRPPPEWFSREEARTIARGYSAQFEEA